MNIIFRNYLRLLRSGCFGSKEDVEPMSAWKWGKLIELADMHCTTALIGDGMALCKDQFFMQIPPRLTAQLHEATKKTVEKKASLNKTVQDLFMQLSNMQCRPILIGSHACAALYDEPFHCLPKSIELFFPYETQGRKADFWAEDYGDDVDYPDKHSLKYTWEGATIIHYHRLLRLSNKLMGHSIQNVIEQELRENKAYYTKIDGYQIETLPPTLSLFVLLNQISQNMLTHGIRLTELIDLGVFLKKIGDRVDYVKLQTWTDKLKMQRMLQLIGQLMMTMLSFPADELPFTTVQKPTDIRAIIQEILVPSSMGNKIFSFIQYDDSIFLHTKNSSVVLWHARRSARFLKYYPSESLSSFFSSFTHSLSDIEE